jgi:hypothetical protein
VLAKAAMLRSLTQLVVKTNRRELMTDIATACALGAAGDIICQLAVEKRRLIVDLPLLGRTNFNESSENSDFDTRRVVALTVFGSVYVGGFLHYLYRSYSIVVLAAAKNLPFPANIAKQLSIPASTGHRLAKLVVDNAHCGLIYTPAFFIGAGMLQGGSFAEALATLNREWSFTYFSCTAFWVPYMYLNFTYFKTAQHVQVMAAGNLVWNVIIDYIAHRGEEGEPKEVVPLPTELPTEHATE